MKPAPGVWGIDLGQCALKALRLQEIDGQLTATAFDYVEYPKILTQPDADPDALTREALETFLSRNVLRGDTVCISVPGQSGLARFVKLPPVEEKKIADIVKFEAKQQIPFNLDEVVWAFQKLGDGMVVDGFALDTEVGLFAMKRDMIKRYLDHFNGVKVEIHIIQMAPLALCNFVAYDLLNKDANTPTEGTGPCIAALDIGTDSSNLVITDGGKVIWQRPIPLGGNHFTRVLTKELKLTFAKAEHTKRNAAKSGQAELKKILAALKPVLNDFVGEVQRSLGFFTNAHKDANIQYMLGLGNAFRLPGLQRFLAEKLGLEVRKIDKMSRLTSDTTVSAPIFQENVLSFGVAYGLALQGTKRSKLVTNLLPPEIHKERLVRAKKPWFAAVAAVLALAIGGAALGNHWAAQPYLKKEVTDEMKRAETVSGEAAKATTKNKQIISEATKEGADVDSIVAGNGERLNWLSLTKFISDCVPQPDATNLDEAGKAAYFLKGPVSGAQALENYMEWAKKAGQKDAKDGDIGEGGLAPNMKYLIQYHIDVIDSRYCDDLADF